MLVLLAVIVIAASVPSARARVELVGMSTAIVTAITLQVVRQVNRPNDVSVSIPTVITGLLGPNAPASRPS